MQVTNEDQGLGIFWRDPNQTNQYSTGSPANGAFLSFNDEDYIANDCILWNGNGIADNSSWNYDVTFPYYHQSQVHFYGTGSNPMEPARAKISWDVRTVNDSTDWNNPTSSVSVNHSCYPSQWVFVNHLPVYQFNAPKNASSAYIFNCLVLQNDKVINTISATHVPCW